MMVISLKTAGNLGIGFECSILMDDSFITALLIPQASKTYDSKALPSLVPPEFQSCIDYLSGEKHQVDEPVKRAIEFTIESHDELLSSRLLGFIEDNITISGRDDIWKIKEEMEIEPSQLHALFYMVDTPILYFISDTKREGINKLSLFITDISYSLSK